MIMSANNFVVMLLILWLCAVHSAQGQGSIIAPGDTVVMKTADRLKGAVLCFAPSAFCGGCSQDLDAIADECQRLGVPRRVYVQDGGLGSGIYSLAEDRPMVTIYDDELGAYAGLYRVARSPFVMSVSVHGTVQTTGIPGAVGFEVDPILESIRASAVAGSGEAFLGPAANRVRFSKTVCPVASDSIVEAFLAPQTDVRYDRERDRYVLVSRDSPSKLLLLNSSGSVITTMAAMPSNFTYNLNYPWYFAVSSTGDSLLAYDWDMYDNRVYLYWFSLRNGRADSIPVPPILNDRYKGVHIYDRPSATSFHSLRHDVPSTGRRLDDRSSIMAIDAKGYRLFGVRPQIYDTDSVLPVESGTYMAIHENYLWTISEFRDSLTRYDLRTWDSLSVPIGLSPTYYSDPLPVLREHYRDPMTRRNTRSRMSQATDLLYDPVRSHMAIVYTVPVSKFTKNASTSSSFTRIWVAVLVDATTGQKIREVEFPMATIPSAFHDGRFLCSAYYGSKQIVKWYDMPAE